MKKIFLSIALVMFALSSVRSQEVMTQTIRGQVTDAVSGFPLIGAYVILENSDPKIVTVTDVNGMYELKKIPLGRQSIQVNYIGYETRTINNLLLVSGKEFVIDVKLDEKLISIEEVVIRKK